MPKVTKHKANKDHPRWGIKKGDQYYSWKRKTGPASGIEYKSLTYPRPSQLNTGFAGQLGDIQLDLEKIDDVEELRSMIDTIRELGEECQGSYDNMPEGLQQGDTGQLLEERAQGLDSWADDLDTAADDIETQLSDFDEKVEAYQTYLEEKDQYDNDLQEYEDSKDENGDTDEVEPDEPDEPELPEGLEADDVRIQASVDEARKALVQEAVSEAAGSCPL